MTTKTQIIYKSHEVVSFPLNISNLTAVFPSSLTLWAYTVVGLLFLRAFAIAALISSIETNTLIPCAILVSPLFDDAILLPERLTDRHLFLSFPITILLSTSTSKIEFSLTTPPSLAGRIIFWMAMSGFAVFIFFATVKKNGRRAGNPVYLMVTRTLFPLLTCLNINSAENFVSLTILLSLSTSTGEVSPSVSLSRPRDLHREEDVY
mmetsp:Transcript_4635/g.6574  ORF Transcript_4635/g.6574 Transcript_4635/m.6574 type:complete len:207 (-) Transcript_4635:204-824(-)